MDWSNGKRRGSEDTRPRCLVLTVAALIGSLLAVVAIRASSQARVPAVTAATTIDESRFVVTPVIPDGELDEPMMFDVARDGRIYIAERKGALKQFDPTTNILTTVAVIPTNHQYRDAAGKPTREAEEGLIGLALDPRFDENHWIYLRYADPVESKHVLSRWELRDGHLVDGSKKDLLSFYVQRRECCHIGGGLTFDGHGNLYMTVGANSPDDVSAADPNDLRGKIVRVHPEPDGTYSIPPGNLYPPGTPNTRPEIYVMGLRNPWRPTVDSATGWLYWGEVGDGWDEFNRAEHPGFFGWPYWEGNNAPRAAAAATRSTLRPDVPAPTPALITYDSSPSAVALLGAGTRCSVGGPIYHRSDLPSTAARPWPAHFEGRWIITDCVRAWIVSVNMAANGTIDGFEQIAPSYRPSTPLDLKFGPDGDLYVLEYGVNFFMRNETARLSKIEYRAGNRPPIAKASVSRRAGIPPFNVQLSSNGSDDPDHDRLRYEWTISSDADGSVRTVTGQNPTVPFVKTGSYTVTLTVTDPAGATGTASVNIVSGNDAPNVAITVDGNPTYYVPGRPFAYAVHVSDREDRQIAPEQIALSIDYVPETFDIGAIRSIDKPVDATTKFAVASALMAKSDCRACHNTSTRTIGPAMAELAAKYRVTDEPTVERLARKVRAGGSGVWGTEQAMPPHPALTLNEARTIVRAMLSINNTNVRTLPLTGSFTPTIPPGESGAGSFVIHAAYSDHGANGLPVQTSDAVAVLRSTLRLANSAEYSRGATPAVAFGGFETGMILGDDAYLGFSKIDVSGVRAVALWSGGRPIRGHVEIRRDSPAGPLLGQGGSDAVDATGARGRVGARRGGAYGGIEGYTYDNVGSAIAITARVPDETISIAPTSGTHDLYIIFRQLEGQTASDAVTLNAIRLVFQE